MRSSTETGKGRSLRWHSCTVDWPPPRKKEKESLLNGFAEKGGMPRAHLSGAVFRRRMEDGELR